MPAMPGLRRESVPASRAGDNAFRCLSPAYRARLQALTSVRIGFPDEVLACHIHPLSSAGLRICRIAEGTGCNPGIIGWNPTGKRLEKKEPAFHDHRPREHEPGPCPWAKNAFRGRAKPPPVSLPVPRGSAPCWLPRRIPALPRAGKTRARRVGSRKRPRHGRAPPDPPALPVTPPANYLI
jgi:hypothetical protein